MRDQSEQPAARRLRYSPSEQALLDLLPTNGESITSVELIRKRWPKLAERPFHAAIVVNTTLKTLIQKIEHNGENFRIEKGPRLGPYPTRYRIKVSRRDE